MPAPLDRTLRDRYEVLCSLWRPPVRDAATDWDGAGILDPDAGICINNHYSLSHVMWAAGLMHELTGEEAHGDRRDAMAALLLEHAAGGYAPYDPNTVHWDFNNTAWLSCARLPRAGRVAELARRAGGLNRENGTWAGNWLAMRRLNRDQRASLGLRSTNWRHLPEAYLYRRLFRDDGGVDEFPERSRPIQYHAYILAIMLRRMICRGRISRRDEARLLRGATFLLAHVDEAGNANHRGRGQYQLFFEGCARYVLEVLAAWFDEAEDGPCRTALAHLDRQDWPVRPDGLLALVRTSPDSDRTGAFYDYHHPTVYNAFDLAWRLQAVVDRAAIAGRARPRMGPPERREGLFPDSGVAVRRWRDWLVVLSAGEDMYLSDVGVTFAHIGGPRGVLFTAPGGPHPGRYGGLHGSDHLRWNVFSPLVVGPDGQGLPHFHKGAIGEADGATTVQVQGPAGSIRREFRITGPRIEVTDVLRTRTAAGVRHVFHWAVPEPLRLERTADGRYSVAAPGAPPLAELRFADDRIPDLSVGDSFRGPGGVVRPWFLDARSMEDRITFTLELQP